jgi:hypothetical protein
VQRGSEPYTVTYLVDRLSCAKPLCRGRLARIMPFKTGRDGLAKMVIDSCGCFLGVCAGGDGYTKSGSELI